MFVVGTFAANILISRTFGASGPTALAIVTIGTQFAFIAAAGTRFGMDMASVRYVAIEVGAGHPGRVRPVVTRAAIIAGSVSVVLGALTFAFAGPIGRALGARQRPSRRSRRSARPRSRSRSWRSPTRGWAAAAASR